MLNFISNFFNKLNQDGIPIPLLRDHGVGSVSFTLLIISFVNVIYAVDSAKPVESLMYGVAVFATCGSMYFGKKFQLRGLAMKANINEGTKE